MEKKRRKQRVRVLDSGLDLRPMIRGTGENDRFEDILRDITWRARTRELVLSFSTRITTPVIHPSKLSPRHALTVSYIFHVGVHWSHQRQDRLLQPNVAKTF